MTCRSDSYLASYDDLPTEPPCSAEIAAQEYGGLSTLSAEESRILARQELAELQDTPGACAQILRDGAMSQELAQLLIDLSEAPPSASRATANLQRLVTESLLDYLEGRA